MEIKSVLKDYLKFCKHYLGIKHLPVVKIVNDPNWTEQEQTFGQYHPSEHFFYINIHGRHVLDILRTVGHELVHHKQHEIKCKSLADRSEMEHEANKFGGMLVKVYSFKNPEVFKG